MSGNPLSFARRTHNVLSRIVPDRRRHKRVSITMLGRFMRENKQEYPCKLLDISVGGAAVAVPVNVEMGERVVAYFEHIGGIEGIVTRRFEGGFAFKIQATLHKRQKLAAQLTWLVNRSELDDVQERVHVRLVPASKQSSLQLADGRVLNCRVLDVSISGASVATTTQPEIDSEVMLGKLRARVVRHHPDGIGVRFIDIQNPAALRRHFGRHETASHKA
jgi:hypothetical protein